MQILSSLSKETKLCISLILKKLLKSSRKKSLRDLLILLKSVRKMQLRCLKMQPRKKKNGPHTFLKTGLLLALTKLFFISTLIGFACLEERQLDFRMKALAETQLQDGQNLG